MAMKPDVLCVKGLLRPEATALALEAARGRIVLAELEAFDSASAFYSFPESSRYWLSRTARFISNQRVVPRLCPDCREPAEFGRELEDALRLTAEELESLRLFRSRGCGSCSESGYQGLTGVFEWIDVDEGVRQALAEARTIPGIRDMLPREGASGLRQTALRMVSEGIVALRDALSLVA
jgi:type II secretory ATPase GspE/PulE/Tfp pilus assembly ATPase PilB-like protein